MFDKYLRLAHSISIFRAHNEGTYGSKPIRTTRRSCVSDGVPFRPSPCEPSIVMFVISPGPPKPWHCSSDRNRTQTKHDQCQTLDPTRTKMLPTKQSGTCVDVAETNKQHWCATNVVNKHGIENPRKNIVLRKKQLAVNSVF